MINRRHLLGAGGTLALGLSRSRLLLPQPAWAFDPALPPDLGQTDLTVFVPETGHTIRGSMLDYWRANGTAAVYGNPISEPFTADDGYYSQAFERAVFQYRPEYLDTEDPIMRLMPVGEPALGATIATLSGDPMTRPLGHALLEARHPLAADDPAVAAIVGDGGSYDDTSGHTLSGDFLGWYNRHEGDFYLGQALTEAVYDGIGTAQYFEGGTLRQLNDGSIGLIPLGRHLIDALGIDTTPVPQGDLPAYDPSLFSTADNPAPSGDETTPGRHWVEVSIGDQQLWAYQGIDSVLTTLVSTGLSPNDTAPGRFHVRLKFPSQTMEGFTGDTGEVVGFGNTAPSTDAVPFKVKDVPNVMYFSLSAEALHGCYWHNNFGNPMSHGCVNLLDVAAWMYGWAPLGTEVIIHE